MSSLKHNVKSSLCLPTLHHHTVMSLTLTLITLMLVGQNLIIDTYKSTFGSYLNIVDIHKIVALSSPPPDVKSHGACPNTV